MRLGVNIDHVATLRNVRGADYPDLGRAALAAQAGGADLITIHLREDRRHIRDDDVAQLLASQSLPINLEMAITAEMQRIALANRPAAVCLVPERRQELTTEGGLDALKLGGDLAEFVKPLRAAGITVSLFLDPDHDQLLAAQQAGATAVELHTGAYAHGKVGELVRLQQAAARVGALGMACHAGHGLTFANVHAIAAIPEVEELNIGHFLVAEAVFIGLSASVAEMKRLMMAARSHELNGE
ncbi:MAG: pyridoxine 5'-phosphate synthase [Alphaproteobacteria bacterium]|nr:pyridoxine 5'-phosphate synthase [Alphaproteobacteria bacterium]